MAIVVQKFGGSSVASCEHIKRVSRIIQQKYRQNKHIVVVVSAMQGVTDQLLSQAKILSSLNNSMHFAEHDVILSAGEQIAAALLTLALQEINIRARSLMGWQVPIITDNNYGGAKIQQICCNTIKQNTAQGNVVIIAGCQGVNNDCITTLGRGGSDISAVALAAALKAQICEIYTDVNGVYTADPKIVPYAHRLPAITYEEMLEIAALGARVLHTRSIELAIQYNVSMHILSSLTQGRGTYLVHRTTKLEKSVITSIVYNLNEVKVSIFGVVDNHVKILDTLRQHDITINTILQSSTEKLIITINKTYLAKAEKALKAVCYKNFTINKQIAVVSIVGLAVASNTEIIYRMFKVLSLHKIGILAIKATGHKISVIIARDHAMLAVRLLHDEYILNTKDDQSM